MALEPTGVRLVAENSSGFASALGAAGKAVTGFVGLVAGAAVGIGAGIAGGLGVAAAAGLGFNNSLEQASARIQAFTKDSEATAAVLDMVRRRAAETPFAFNEMADAAAALGPVAKSSGKDLEGLIAQAEILAASNPAEGLAGAAFALREAASGDFTSAIERFNLSRVYINQLKDEGVPALEIISKALVQAGYDADLVANLANTASGRLGVLTDTFTNLAGIATKPFFDTFSSSLGDVNKILSDNAPLLEQAAAGLGQILAPAAQLLGDIMRGAAQGLVNFAKNLPSIAQQAGRVAGVLMAVIDTAKQWWGALSPLLGQALSWGANFIGQLAKGMLDAASVVLSALMQIGAIITSWLAPGSPPKLLPDLPDWGQSAVNQFMAGWATPDLSAFDTLAGTIEGMLRDLVPTGQTDEGGVLSMIFGSRDAIARAVEEFRTLGSVSEESFGAIRDAAGPAGESAERFARAYFEVEEASREVAKAQDDVEEATRAVDDAQKALNDTLSAFDAILNPLNKQLQGIQDRKDEIKDAQRIAELQEELASGKLDEQEAELARLEIAEIQTEQQIRNAEREKEAAAEAAQANLDAAEEGQAAAEGRLEAAEAAEQAAQAQLEREQAAIGLQSEQNRLIGEQISLLQKLADAASKGAGAGGGLAGGLGGALAGLGAGDGADNPIAQIGQQVEKINEVVAGFQQGFETAKNSVTRNIQAIQGAFAPLTGAVQALSGPLDVAFRIAQQFGQLLIANWQPALAAVGGILAAQLIPAVAGMAGAFGAALAAFAPLAAAAAAGVLLYEAWSKNFLGIQEISAEVFGAIGPLIMPVVDALGGLFNAMADAGPLSSEVGEAFGLLGSRLATFVTEAIPAVAAGLGQLAQNLVTWVQEQAPIWGAQLATLGSQLGQWVMDALPGLITALFDARTALINWVLESLPGWAAQLDNLRTAMINWVAAALPDLGTNLGKITALLLRKTGEFIATVGPKLLELAGQFVVWVATEALPRLPGELAKLGTALLTGIGNFIKEVAPELLKLANQFIDWVRDEVLPDLPGKLAEIGSAIVKGISDFLANVGKEAAKVGEAIIDGIAGAIRNGARIVADAARDAAKAAFDAAKKFLGIASPSKLFTALGLNVGDSFAGGILARIPAAIEAAQQLAEDVRDKVMRELEKLAKDVQTFMRERLSGRIGLARGAIGGLDVLKDAKRDLENLKRQSADLNEEIRQGAQDIRDERQQYADRQEEIGRKAQEARDESAKKISELEAERAAAAITAAQNLDPAKRQQALDRIAEIDKAIEDERAAAAARERDFEDEVAAARAAHLAAEEDALNRQLDLSRERDEIERQYLIAVERERAIREQLAEAQAEAARIALEDPAAGREFLELRQRQIAELADLRAEMQTETDEGMRQLIADQIRLLEAAQALELEQFQQEAQERADAIARLGQPGEIGEETGDAFLAGLKASIGAGGAAIADALLQSIAAGIAASLTGSPAALVSSAASIGGATGSSTNFGDQNVTINAAGFTVSQLKAVIREVMSEQARSASNTARGTA